MTVSYDSKSQNDKLRNEVSKFDGFGSLNSYTNMHLFVNTSSRQARASIIWLTTSKLKLWNLAKFFSTYHGPGQNTQHREFQKYAPKGPVLGSA